MTDFAALAEAIERDRENGTPGPWDVDQHGYNDCFGDVWLGEEVRVTENAEINDTARIARLPALEDAFLVLLAERDALLAQLARLTEDEIAAIEKGNRRWHGENHPVIPVRWEPYKPDGARQMGKKGRWQEMVGSGDFWRWSNCDRPAALTQMEKKDGTP